MTKKTQITPTHENYDTETEREKLKNAAAKLQLTIPESFLNIIQQGDIIEIYSFPKNTQIYSNNEFRRLSSYTDEQMKNIPFPKLFWRSDEDHFKLLERAKEVTLHETEAVRWALPNQEVVESLHPRKRTFEIQLGFISPCYDIQSGIRSAWASTIRVSFIFEWTEALST
jgi:hypothetical protein